MRIPTRSRPGRFVQPRPALRRRLLAALLGVALSFAAPANAGREVATLPAVPLAKLDGTPASSDEWLGKPLVVNVWATWCAPCRSEMPSLQRLGDLLAPAGIAVAALSLDTDHNLVREFVLKYRIRLPIGIALSPGSAGPALGATALPLTLYVDAAGHIVGRHLGPRDWSEDAVVQELKRKLLPVAR